MTFKRSTDFDILDALLLYGKSTPQEVAEMIEKDSSLITDRLATLSKNGYVDGTGNTEEEQQFTITGKGQVAVRLRAMYDQASDFNAFIEQQMNVIDMPQTGKAAVRGASKTKEYEKETTNDSTNEDSVDE